MNLKKIGSFIMQLRVDKGLTQNDLANKLAINTKTISKLEQGTKRLDISMLKKLSFVLDIPVRDLLNGEKCAGSYDNQVEVIKFYSSEAKNEVISIFFIIFLILLLVFVNILNWANNNKFKVYKIESMNENVNIDGYTVLNKNKTIIVLKNIEYNNSLEENSITDCMDVYMLVDDNIVSTYHYDLLSKDDDLFDKFVMDLNGYFNNNKNINLSSLSDIRVRFVYDIHDKKKRIEVPLRLVTKIAE